MHTLRDGAADEQPSERNAMRTTFPDAQVYLVPLIDVNWLVYAPVDRGRDFRVDPPKVEHSVVETRTLCREMRSDGRYILTSHSGTHSRTGYNQGEMLEIYQDAVSDGGELAVHLHEEIKGEGTRYNVLEHMRAVFADCRRRLQSAGIEPVAYRSGHYAVRRS
jgi:hypothetical protein